MNKREWMLHHIGVMMSNGLYSGANANELISAAAIYDAIVAATTEPADEGWIEHHGEKPYPEGRVEWVNRHGSIGTDDSDDLIWSHDGDPWDIVKWRPA